MRVEAACRKSSLVAIAMRRLLLAAALGANAAVLASSLESGAASPSTTLDLAESETVVVVVRHAEKEPPAAAAAGGSGNAEASKDPPLSPDGQRRATALADALADARVSAIFSTPYRRTLQTAAPLAARQDVEVTQYAADTTATALAQRIRRDHRGRTVLVVGHSNTLPGIVAALSGTAVTPVGDGEYGRLYLIAIDARGGARLLRLGFPAIP